MIDFSSMIGRKQNSNGNVGGDSVACLFRRLLCVTTVALVFVYYPEVFAQGPEKFSCLGQCKTEPCAEPCDSYYHVRRRGCTPSSVI